MSKTTKKSAPAKTETTKKEFKAVVGEKNYPTIAKVINRKDGAGSFLVFADNVTVLIDGKEFPMNEKRIANLATPTQKLEDRYSAGFVDDEKIESLRETVANVEKTVRFEVDLVRAQSSAE